MILSEAFRFIALRSLGNFLVLLSLYGVVVTFAPVVKHELQYRIIQARGIEFRVSSIKYEVSSIQNTKTTNTSDALPTDASGRDVGFSEILTGEKEQELIPKDPLFSVLIPKVAANARVFANVDPENPAEYNPILKQGVAHAKGSVMPGSPGNTYLFAHSADNWWEASQYNAVFYTLNNLDFDDSITIFFENKRYDYKVTQKIISDPNDITLLTQKHEGPHRLVLQTCWPPGTTWKRLYIIAEQKET